jgi:hypothetical protein
MSGVRLWIVSFLVALVGLFAPPVAASHTTRITMEIDMGETFDLLRGAGELVDVVADPPGILEIRLGGRLRVEAECTRVGKTVVTMRYRAGGEVHTSVIAVTCVQKER